MRMQRIFSIALIAACCVVALHCSKSSSSPTQPTPAPSLTAVPPSVAVAVGTSQDVAVSGGTPPYSISTPPNADATALLQNADSIAAIVHITGVTVASVSTSVVIRDNTPTTPKSVSIPITVH